MLSRIQVAPLAGAWIEIAHLQIKKEDDDVAPLAGAWIEIVNPCTKRRMSLSLPSRERGLKLTLPDCQPMSMLVAPLAGAWIEIAYRFGMSTRYCVAPLAGAWIEMRTSSNFATANKSLPSRERGLKCCGLLCHHTILRRSPRGSVD